VMLPGFMEPTLKYSPGVNVAGHVTSVTCPLLFSLRVLSLDNFRCSISNATMWLFFFLVLWRRK
jgi:hypothetical protein